MIRFYCDLEFNSHGGELISIALVRQDGASLYLLTDCEPYPIHPWVAEHVMPFIYDCPVEPLVLPESKWGETISDFIYSGDEPPQIIADWPSDIRDLCNLLMTGPGTSVPMGNQTHLTIVRHIDVYPTDLPGAVQHNAWWDAMALKHYIETAETA